MRPLVVAQLDRPPPFRSGFRFPIWIQKPASRPVRSSPSAMCWAVLASTPSSCATS